MTETGRDVEDSAAAAAGAALWLHALGDTADAGAHHLKNLLNGVAVNLEVARSRSARGADAASIAPFAATAAERFEAASAVAEALLALVRPEPAPANVSGVASRVALLLGGADDRATVLLSDGGGAGEAVTSVSPEVVRAAVARALLAATGEPGEVTCETRCAGDILLRVARADGVAVPLDPALERSLADHGVRTASPPGALELAFPAVTR